MVYVSRGSNPGPLSGGTKVLLTACRKQTRGCAVRIASTATPLIVVCLNRMDKQIINKAIDTVFEIISDKEKVKALDDLQKRLGFENDFFSFSSFLDANEDRLINFLDWFFYNLSPDFQHPDSDFGGLVSYALYDAATPYIDGKPYDLKNKSGFESYLIRRWLRRDQQARRFLRLYNGWINQKRNAKKF